MNQTTIYKSAASVIFITILAAIVAAYLTGCTTLSGFLTVPTDYGTAVIRSNGGKTSVDLELPRR